MSEQLETRPPTTPSERSTHCPACGDVVATWEAFCEGCGTQLTPTEAIPSEVMAEDVPVSRVQSRDQDRADAVRTCLECGGRVDADGYCEQCGTKAPSARDHFVESPASWVGGVCDRGVRRQRNEDAMALSAEPAPGSHAVLVVCDGVSSSENSHLASLAAARAARGVLVAHHPVGMALPESQIQTLTATLVDAVQAANEAVVAGTDPESVNAPSCTIAAAEVDGDTIVWGSLGDSRIYWLPDTGTSRQLSVDDSMAQLHMAAGMSRAEAESGPGSHAITRWLGLDAPDLQPTTGYLVAPGNGWLLVCSDGLWNYASDPDDLETVVAQTLLDHPTATDPTVLAQELVLWANAQGGKDNVTVALARFGPLDDFPGHQAAALESPIVPEAETTTRHTGPVRPDRGSVADDQLVAAGPPAVVPREVPDPGHEPTQVDERPAPRSEHRPQGE